MPELKTADPIGGRAAASRSSAAPSTNGSSNGSASTASNGKAQLRHVLEFEKPLAKLEEQIQILQAQQEAKGVDYSKELRQLRTQYTSILRHTYEHLSAWETVQVARHPQRPLLDRKSVV